MYPARPMKQLHTSIQIPAPAQLVWTTLVDFPAHHLWNPLFASVEGKAQVGARLRIAARKDDGQAGLVFRPQVIEAKTAQRLRWQGSLFLKGLFDGLHSFELHALDGQNTQLIHQERFSGILVPFMGRRLEQTQGGFERFNQALREQVLKKMQQDHAQS